jgi:hypothetical protein
VQPLPSNCPQVEEFLKWYNENRFSLEYDENAGVYRVEGKKSEGDESPK